GWTLGKVAAISTPLGGGARQTRSITGSHSTQTFATGGPGANLVRETRMNYVTAAQITVPQITLLGLANLAMFGRMQVTFSQVVGQAPEPSTLLLLGGGLAAIGAVRSRSRSSDDRRTTNPVTAGRGVPCDG